MLNKVFVSYVLIYIVVLFFLTTVLFSNLSMKCIEIEEEESMKCSHFQVLDTEESDIVHNITSNILSMQRQLIREEMLFRSLKNTSFEMSELIPELGGRSIKNLIVSSWRSGSTFLGDIMKTIPGSYYHFEPIIAFDLKYYEGRLTAEETLYFMVQILNCNYTSPDLEFYMNFSALPENDFLFMHNTRLWRVCKLFPSHCFQPKLLQEFCNLFPVQNTKTVRMNLNLTFSLIEDEKSNMKIVYLIRDPRGIFVSRRSQSWCATSKYCGDVEFVCNLLNHDALAAIKLFKLYPNKFRFVRYEDLSVNPFNITEYLFDFFGFTMNYNVIKFLNTHVKFNKGDDFSTFRDSKKAPFMWTKKITYNETLEIQQHCSVVMEAFGYRQILNEAELSFSNFTENLLTVPYLVKFPENFSDVVSKLINK